MDLLQMLQNKAEELTVEAEKKGKDEKQDVEKKSKPKKDKKDKNNDEKIKLQQSEEDPKRSEKRSNKRRNAAFELMTTENTYVKNLLLIMNGFATPLETNGIISSADVSAIFSNIKTLINIHKDLLRELKERISDNWSDSQCVGDIMFKTTPFFKLYSAYARNYDHAFATVQTLTKNNPKFTSFLQSNIENPSFGGLSLTGYLIMPIQRIPRYKMLLEVIWQNTDTDHPDHVDLKRAMDAIEGIADTLNLDVEKESGLNMLMHIQSLVTIPIVIPTRRFIREGSLRTNCHEKKTSGSKRRTILVSGGGGSSSSPALGAGISPIAEDEELSMSHDDLSGSKKKKDNKKKLKSKSIQQPPPGSRSPGRRPSHPSLSVKAKDRRFRSTSVSDLRSCSMQVVNPGVLPECKMFLCNDIVIITHPKKRAKTRISNLVTTWVRPADLFARALELVTLEHSTCLLFVADPEERDSWLTSINEAITALVSQNKETQETRNKYNIAFTDGEWRVVIKKEQPVVNPLLSIRSEGGSRLSLNASTSSPNMTAAVRRLRSQSHALLTVPDKGGTIV